MRANSLLARERTIAGPGFNRWLVPPAALSIHLAIGQAYAFSVFNAPLSQLVGVNKHVEGKDWELTTIGWIFSIAIVFLGLSAAVFGKWLEKAGPRKAMLASAICFGGGFLVSALGVALHQIVLLYLGYGVIGGIGLGLGYISPVSTLIKWFPDRPGMATGHGHHGLRRRRHDRIAASRVFDETVQHLLLEWRDGNLSCDGSRLFFVHAFRRRDRSRAAAELEASRICADRSAQELVTEAQVSADDAIRAPQFYLLWAILFLNVTAGIGVLGQAAVMIQEMFGDVSKEAASGFVGLLSLFNMGGRFFWSSLSDYIGRKNTYMCFLLLGALFYALIPTTGQMGSKLLFVLGFGVILSMYGGGFATVPAYLRDLFGTMQVGAIHGRLLTAWSAAGVAGPVLVNYIREYLLQSGVPKAHAYGTTMYIMAGLLVVGAACNSCVKEVHERLHSPNSTI